MKMTGEAPFQYFFLDEELDTYYAEEKRTGTVTMIFSILAIFIASLGLFGLTLYNSQKRTREIGIRKVLGASISDILGILMGLLFPAIAAARRHAIRTRAQVEIKRIEDAFFMYELEYDQWPGNINDYWNWPDTADRIEK